MWCLLNYTFKNTHLTKLDITWSTISDWNVSWWLTCIIAGGRWPPGCKDTPALYSSQTFVSNVALHQIAKIFLGEGHSSRTRYLHMHATIICVLPHSQVSSTTSDVLSILCSKCMVKIVAIQNPRRIYINCQLAHIDHNESPYWPAW